MESDVEYSVEKAQKFVDRRVVVTLRHVYPDGGYRISGFWGIVSLADEDGFILTIEGGLKEKEWYMPPDLSPFEPADQEVYQLSKDSEPIYGVDFEAYYAIDEESTTQAKK